MKKTICDWLVIIRNETQTIEYVFSSIVIMPLQEANHKTGVILRPSIFQNGQF
jgi:hypothetical protein